MNTNESTLLMIPSLHGRPLILESPQLYIYIYTHIYTYIFLYIHILLYKNVFSYMNGHQQNDWNAPDTCDCEAGLSEVGGSWAMRESPYMYTYPEICMHIYIYICM